MNQIHNKPELLEFRKTLRNYSTSAESVLWKCLQKRQLEGRKFRRQHSVENYILDFYCPAEKLAIELDGAYHFTSQGFENDIDRTRFLNQIGIKVVRFENIDVFDDIENVLNEIRSCFKNSPPLPPSKIGVEV